MVNNFISISAVSNAEQLAGIDRINREESIVYPVVIGYQVSNKSINQGTQNSRQPRFAELGELDKQTRGYGLITAVHYYTKNNDTIIEDLEKIAEQGVDPSRTLLQFNTLPPTQDTLRKVSEMGYQTIFKVAVSNKQSPDGGYAVWKGSEVIDVGSGNVSPLVDQARSRKDHISHVMFDPSHGTNLNLDLDEESLAIRFGKEIASSHDFEDIGLVYAGGINPENVGRLTETLRTFFPGRFSIDAESGVRTNDQLDLIKVREYLVNYADSLR